MRGIYFFSYSLKAYYSLTIRQQSNRTRNPYTVTFCTIQKPKSRKQIVFPSIHSPCGQTIPITGLSLSCTILVSLPKPCQINESADLDVLSADTFQNNWKHTQDRGLQRLGDGGEYTEIRL
jgi:hypothetical protein